MNLKYIINDNCLACANCIVVCPDNAIDTGYAQSNNSGGFGDPFIINNNCSGCGICTSVCWADAIDTIAEKGY